METSVSSVTSDCFLVNNRRTVDCRLLVEKKLLCYTKVWVPSCRYPDITSGDKSSVGQNFRRDKISEGSKRPEGQNIWRDYTSGDKTSFCDILNVHVKN
jgi:hypothetical protein